MHAGVIAVLTTIYLTMFLRSCHCFIKSILKSRQSYREDSVEPQTDTPKATTRRSLMQYSTFDWSAVPFSEERRLKPEDTEPARIVTMNLR